MDIVQTPVLPQRPRPIVSIGAGSIVRDAHLTAYRLAGFDVAAVHDLNPGRAEALARDFGIARVYASLADAISGAPADAAFDLALPAAAICDVLGELPDGAAVLWMSLPLVGNWFPHAFVGTMASLMRRANGETTELPTSVEDAFRTMAAVEACYQSSESGGTPIPS